MTRVLGVLCVVVISESSVALCVTCVLMCSCLCLGCGIMFLVLCLLCLPLCVVCRVLCFVRCSCCVMGRVVYVVCLVTEMRDNLVNGIGVVLCFPTLCLYLVVGDICLGYDKIVVCAVLCVVCVLWWGTCCLDCGVFKFVSCLSCLVVYVVCRVSCLVVCSVCCAVFVPCRE